MRYARTARLALLLALAVACAGGPTAERSGWPAREQRLLIGVGDRLVLHAGDSAVSLPDEARRLELPLDLFQVWLPRGWQPSWIPPSELRALAAAGTTPVVVHYFFGQGISRERVVAERDDWLASLRRLGRAIALPFPVLVVLEPEFNDAPPAGETPITHWRGFGDELRAAAALLRHAAPNARIGVCAGDFSPDRDLEAVLEVAAPALDFLAFQEMRAATAPEAQRPDYGEVGRAAVAYARYLREAFGRPLLLAYVAVSSYGGWEERQAAALADLAARRDELRGEGVFGVIYFQLRDDPDHTGYFGAAERHFGLVDAAGRPKPALAAFRGFASSGR